MLFRPLWSMLFSPMETEEKTEETEPRRDRGGPRRPRNNRRATFLAREVSEEGPPWVPKGQGFPEPPYGFPGILDGVPEDSRGIP